jgi:hypothetical protein
MAKVAICVCACLIPLENLHATQHKDVLIVHSVGREFRPWNEYAEQIRAELQALYAERAPDLIVAIGAPATAFVQRHRQQLFPASPALFTAIEQRRLQHSSLTENDAVVAVKLDFRVLFESFLRISPDTKIVAVVNGTSPNELFWRSEIQKELRPLEGPIDIRWYDNLPFQDILKQTSNLPPHSAIFWNTRSSMRLA